jgi:hypothetical protein
MSKFGLERRTFLKGILGGAAVSIGVPALDAMFDGNGTRLAFGQAIPKRFGIWFFGNGIRRAHWIPDQAGPTWVAKEEMAPLATAELRPYVTPVTGMVMMADPNNHPHHSGMAGIFTGQRYFLNGNVRDTISSSFDAPSIDQVVAERWQADPATRAPYRSLEVGICRFRGSDEGTTFQHLSHNGPNNVNPAEYQPIRLFQRLFGTPLSAQLDQARQSVLDAVKADTRALKQRLGASDKARLDQHLESIRSIELRLGTTRAQCATPARPDATYPEPNGQEPIAEKNRVMSDILAMAMACDLTRVFSVLFSSAGAGTVFWMAGAQNGLHQIAHDERAQGAEPQPTLHAAQVFTMQQFAYFLERLRTTPEGAGNLLDSCAILCTTELSEGMVHTNDEFPIVLAGRAGGAMQSGFHYRSNRENTTNVLLTLLRAVGDPRPSFGAGTGLSSTVIPSLLT